MLILAAAKNDTEIMKLLLAHKGIEVNAKAVYLFHLMFILVI